MTVQSPRDARLRLAFSGALQGIAAVGPVAVFRPDAGDRLDAIAAERLHIHTGWRPAFDAFAARDLPVERAPRPGGTPHVAALVCVPRSRDMAQGLIAAACCCTQGPVLVDGQKTDGIDAILRACKARVAVAGPVIKGHGKLFAIDAAEGRAALADWLPQPKRIAGGFVTLPGVFSADGPDPGSMLLAAALPGRLPPRIADLGAGWGWLAAEVLRREGVEEVHLVEAEADALDCARRNVTDPRAVFHWADARSFHAAAGFDAVVMNPPFHPARRPDPELGRAFVAAAARLLHPSGVLWMVANRHLPYADALNDAFADVRELPGSSGAYRLTQASRPRSRPSVAGKGASAVQPARRKR